MNTEGNETGATPLPKPAKSRKLGLLIGGIALVVLVVAGILIYTFVLSTSKPTGTLAANPVYPIYANLDLDGNAYLVNDSGDLIKLAGEYRQAVLTADRKHIVALESDGRLTLFDSKGENKTTIVDSEVSAIYEIRDSGIIYVIEKEPEIEEILEAFVTDYYEDVTYEDVETYFKNNYEWTLTDAMDFYEELVGYTYEEYHDNPSLYHRYLFSDSSTVLIEDAESIAIADNNTGLIFVNENGVYGLTENVAEPVKLQSVKNDYATPLAVSDSGKIFVWSDTSVDETSDTDIYAFVNDDVQELGRLKNEYEYYWSYTTYFINNEQGILISNYYSDSILYWTAESGASSLKLGSTLATTLFYTDRGLLMNDLQREITGIYVTVDNTEQFSDLYYITLDGDRERLLTRISEVTDVCDGTLYYISDDEDLYQVKLDGAKLGEQVKLASDTYTAFLAQDNQTLFYYKNLDETDYTADLYALKGKDEPVKIASDASLKICPKAPIPASVRSIHSLTATRRRAGSPPM